MSSAQSIEKDMAEVSTTKTCSLSAIARHKNRFEIEIDLISMIAPVVSQPVGYRIYWNFIFRLWLHDVVSALCNSAPSPNVLSVCEYFHELIIPSELWTKSLHLAFLVSSQQPFWKTSHESQHHQLDMGAIDAIRKYKISKVKVRSTQKKTMWEKKENLFNSYFFFLLFIVCLNKKDNQSGADQRRINEHIYSLAANVRNR